MSTGAVVPPHLGVADLGPELAELGERLLPRLRGHPLELLDVDAVGLDEPVDEAVHLRLVLGREVALDVELAEGEAQGPLDHGDPALPALAQLGDAREEPAVEGEVGVDERARQVRRRGAHVVEREPGLPVGERCLAQHLARRS